MRTKYFRSMKRLVINDSTLIPRHCSFSQAPTIRQFLLGNLYRPGNENVQKFKIPLNILSAALDSLGDFPFRDPGEVRFEKPVLFIRGIQSKYIPDEALPIIGRFFPMFQLVDIDAGHWVISEQPEAFKRGTSPVSRLANTHDSDILSSSRCRISAASRRISCMYQYCIIWVSRSLPECSAMTRSSPDNQTPRCCSLMQRFQLNMNSQKNLC